MRNQPRIRSAPKISGISERTVSPTETLSRAMTVAARKGVTRLADITGLDRIGIPVFTAVVPKSDDVLSVYNGKGILSADARVGALMESIERQTALNAEIEIVIGSYSRLRQSATPALNPSVFNQGLCNDYSSEKPYEWVYGFDLLARETVLVPGALGGFGLRFAGDGSPFRVYLSNGLASGNCLEEAVCHALCELVERDAWTLADLRSYWLPRARREARMNEPLDGAGQDDYDAYPRIDLHGAGWPIDELVGKFERASLRVVVRDITSDVGVAVVIASAADDWLPGFPQAHSGLGAHPNAEIAVIRALTELAQSRAVDIQGVREDILPAEFVPEEHETHTRRVAKIDHDRWILRDSGRVRRFGHMLSTWHSDIADDIQSILDRLVSVGMERVIVVDLTEPGGFSVVRVIVPGLESWILDHGRLGPRALRFWKAHAVAS
jgi:ribosomal protein S12 methylthiotransferase accessory factor